MTKKLEDITKDFLLISEEEQRAIVARARHNKFVVKPALEKRVRTKAVKEAKTATKAKQTKTKNLLKDLSDEDRKQLILILKGGG